MIFYKVIQYPVGVTIQAQSFGVCQDNQDTQLSFYCVVGTEVRKIYLNESISESTFQLDPTVYLDLTLHCPGWNIRSLNLIQDGVSNKNWYLTQLNTGNMRVVHDSTSYAVNFTNFNQSVTFNNATDLVIKSTGSNHRFFLLYNDRINEGDISVTSGSDNFNNLQQKQVGLWQSPAENTGYRSITYNPDSNLIHLHKNPIQTFPGQFFSYLSTGIQAFNSKIEQHNDLTDPILKVEYNEYTNRFYLFCQTRVYEVHLEKTSSAEILPYISAFPESYRTSAEFRDENSVEVSLVTDGYDPIGSRKVFGRFLSEIDLAKIYESDDSTLDYRDIQFTPSLEYALFTEKDSYGVTERPGSWISINLKKTHAIEAVLTTVEIIAPDENLTYTVKVFGREDKYQPEVLIGTITLTPTEERQQAALSEFVTQQSYYELQIIRLEFSHEDIRLYWLEIFENGLGLGSLWTRNDNVTKSDSFDQVIRIQDFWNWETFDQVVTINKLNFNTLSELFNFSDQSTNTHFSVDKSNPVWVFSYPGHARYSPSTWLFERVAQGGLLRHSARISENTATPNSLPQVSYNSALFSSINNDFYGTFVYSHNFTQNDIYPWPSWTTDLPSLATLPESNTDFLQLQQSANPKLFTFPSSINTPFVFFLDGKLQTEITLDEVTIQISDDTFTAPQDLSERCFFPTKYVAGDYIYLENPDDWFFTEGLVQLTQSFAPTEQLKLIYSRFDQSSSLFKQKLLVPNPDGSQVLFSIPDLQTIYENSEFVFKNNQLMLRDTDYTITNNKIVFQTAPQVSDELVCYFAVPYSDVFTEYIQTELPLITGSIYRIPSPYSLPDEIYAKTLLIFGLNTSFELIRVPESDFSVFPTNIPGEATIEITTPIANPTGRYFIIFQHRAAIRPSIIQNGITPSQFEQKENRYIPVNGGVLLAYNYTSSTTNCYISYRADDDSPSWLIKPYEMAKKSNTELYMFNNQYFPLSDDPIFIFKNGYLQIEGLDYVRNEDYITVYEKIEDTDMYSITFSNRIRKIDTFDQVIQIQTDRITGSYDQTVTIEVVPNVISGFTNEEGEVNFFYTPGPIEGKEVIKLTSADTGQSVLNIVDNNIIELSGFDSTEIRATQYFGDITEVKIKNPFPPKPPEFISHRIYENKVLLNWEHVRAEDFRPTVNYEYKSQIFFGYSTGEVVRLYDDYTVPRFDTQIVSNSEICQIFEHDNGLYAADSANYIYKLNERLFTWEKHFNLDEVIPSSEPKFRLKYFFKYSQGFVFLNSLGIIYSIDNLDEPTVQLITQLNLPIADCKIDQDTLYICTRNGKIVLYDVDQLLQTQFNYLSTEFKSLELSADYIFVGDTLGLVRQLSRPVFTSANQYQLPAVTVEYIKRIGNEIYCSNSRHKLYKINIATNEIQQIASEKQILSIFTNSEVTFFANNYGVIYSDNFKFEAVAPKINPYVSGYFVERSEINTDLDEYWERLTDIISISQYEDTILETNKSYLYRIITVDSAGQISIPSIPYNVVIDNITMPNLVEPIEIKIINTFFSKKNTVKWRRPERDLFGNLISNTVGYKVTRKKQTDPFEEIVRNDCRITNLRYISSFKVTDNNYLNDNRYALLEYPNQNWYEWNSGRCSQLQQGNYTGYSNPVVFLPEDRISGMFVSEVIQAVNYFPQVPKYKQHISWESIRWTADTPSGTGIKVYLRWSDDNVYWSSYREVQNGEQIDTLNFYLQFKVEMTADQLGNTPILQNLKLDYWVEDVVLGKIDLQEVVFTSEYFVQDNLDILFKLPANQQLSTIVLNTLFSPKKLADFPDKVTVSVGMKSSNLPFVKEFAFPDIRQYSEEERVYPLALDLYREDFRGTYCKIQFNRKPEMKIMMDEVEIYRKPNIGEQFAPRFDDNTINWENDGYCSYKVQGYIVDKHIHKEFFTDDHIC